MQSAATRLEHLPWMPWQWFRLNPLFPHQSQHHFNFQYILDCQWQNMWSRSKRREDRKWIKGSLTPPQGMWSGLVEGCWNSQIGMLVCTSWVSTLLSYVKCGREAILMLGQGRWMGAVTPWFSIQPPDYLQDPGSHPGFWNARLQPSTNQYPSTKIFCQPGGIMQPKSTKDFLLFLPMFICKRRF